MTTPVLTEDGKRLAEALVKAGVMWGHGPYYCPHLYIPASDLNTAASLLPAHDGDGAGLREALEETTEALELASTFFPAGDSIEGELRGERLSFAASRARTALARPQPEAKGPVAAGYQPIACAPKDGEPLDLWGYWPDVERWMRSADAIWLDNEWQLRNFGDYLPASSYVNPPRFTHWRRDAGPDSTTPPAEAKTPDAGVESEDEAEADLPRIDRIERQMLEHGGVDSDDMEWMAAMTRRALTPTGSAGEDDTGVREALAGEFRQKAAERRLRADSEPFPNVAQRCLGAAAAYEQAARDVLAPRPPKAETPAGAREGVRTVLAEWFSDAEGMCRAYEGDLPDTAEIYVVAARRSRLYLGTYGELRRAALSTAPAARPGDEVERVLPNVIEAPRAMASDGYDWHLTCEWPDGTETIERVTDNGARALGLDVEALINGDDNDRHGHIVRPSDSSLYDVKCTRCGGTDASGDQRLDQPCVPAAAPAADGVRA